MKKIVSFGFFALFLLAGAMSCQKVPEIDKLGSVLSDYVGHSDNAVAQKKLLGKIRQRFIADFSRSDDDLPELGRYVQLANDRLSPNDSVSKVGLRLLEEKVKRIGLIDSLSRLANNFYSISLVPSSTILEDILAKRFEAIDADSLIRLKNGQGFIGPKVWGAIEGKIAAEIKRKIDLFPVDSLVPYLRGVDQNSPRWEVSIPAIKKSLSEEHDVGRALIWTGGWACQEVSEAADQRLMELYLNHHDAPLSRGEMSSVAKMIGQAETGSGQEEYLESLLGQILLKTEYFDSLVNYLLEFKVGSHSYLMVERRMMNVMPKWNYSLEAMLYWHRFFVAESKPKMELVCRIRRQLNEVRDFRRIISLYKEYYENDAAVGQMILERGERILAGINDLRALANLRELAFIEHQYSRNYRNCIQDIVDQRVRDFLKGFSKEALAIYDQLGGENQYVKDMVGNRLRDIESDEDDRPRMARRNRL
ncbi:MAG: hypothetical protein PHE24_03260 [Patescibacteria group bacterium]|nr:hypothetical protein [Patescibacteria group bacterium]